MPSKINAIALIEDDKTVCDFLANELQSYFTTTHILKFYDGESALAYLKVKPVDIALFDLTLPGIGGIACIQQLKQLHPTMDMITLTVLENAETVFEALKAGAVGYLLKSTPTPDIINAILEVRAGGAPMSKSIARKVINSFQQHSELQNPHLEMLTRREKEIIKYLEKGYLYKEIAELLFISIETARTHVRNIYLKLQVNSRIEALKKTGLI